VAGAEVAATKAWCRKVMDAFFWLIFSFLLSILNCKQFYLNLVPVVNFAQPYVIAVLWLHMH